MYTSRQLISQLKTKPAPLIKLTQKAPICRKSDLKPAKNTYHWPYETTSYNYYNFIFDPLTKNKFNENSKIIQIEGNVASGKTEFASRLADELGMKLMPEVELESYYINDHGYDYRALNPLLPERLRLCDWEMFHENPSRHSMIMLQYVMFKLRLYQYVKAIQHLFNTGQGVILTRSVFTERVFVEAMHNCGWLPKGYVRGDGVRFYDWRLRYNYIRSLTLNTVFKPHLTIYLDTPIDTCMQRIKQSNDPMISSSNALIPEFLEHIAQAYQDVILPKQELNMNVLRIDNSEKMGDGEFSDVVDDIEQLDFTYDEHDTRFDDWRDDRMYFWYFNWRKAYTSVDAGALFRWVDQPWFDIAGMGDSITETDLKLRKALFEANVGPFGHIQDYDSDLRIHNPIKALTSYTNFKKELESYVRTDFV